MRYAEFVALIAISCTLFLFLHTQSLTSRLREMEDRLQEPSSLSAASGLSGNSISQESHLPVLNSCHYNDRYDKMNHSPKTNCQRDDMLRSPQISVNLRVVLFATPSASRLLTLSLLSEKSYMHTRYPKHEHTRSAWGSRVEQQAASNSLLRREYTALVLLAVLINCFPFSRVLLHRHLAGSPKQALTLIVFWR
uniref:Uncharacterized protein n=1 Tax=Anopheles coluzzii TaxID=1518534 RepID=A0A8W7P3C0_ANOCL